MHLPVLCHHAAARHVVESPTRLSDDGSNQVGSRAVATMPVRRLLHFAAWRLHLRTGERYLEDVTTCLACMISAYHQSTARSMPFVARRLHALNIQQTRRTERSEVVVAKYHEPGTSISHRIWGSRRGLEGSPKYSIFDHVHTI